MPTRTPFGGRVAYVAGAAAAWFVAAGGYAATTDLIDDIEQAERARAVHAEVESVRTLLREAESGQRGYLLTHDEGYRLPYEEAAARADESFDALEEAVRGDRLQESRVADLREVGEAKLAELAAVLKADERSYDDALAIVRTGEGRALMLDAVDRLRDIEGHELARLQEAREGKEGGGLRVALALFGQAAFATILLLWLAARAVRERRAAFTFTERLEHDVQERTEELRRENAVRREREEELEELTVELERSNRELNDFAFIASHDLQEPLRKIRAFGDRLVSDHADSLNEEGRDFLERMQGAAQRMSRLISDLLSFSRVHRHGQPFVTVDLNEILRDVSADLEQRVEDTNGRIVVPENLPVIEADPSQMRQLFQNLLGNALKFHPEDRGTTVEVKVEETDDLWRFEVVDDGIGFDPKYKEKVFGPFQRLHGRGTYEGTGIGLAICRRIVERHEGTIDVHSEPGRGTTFVVELAKPEKEST
ncbi:MAG: CHASE3 domain-containing protein [Myxococcales bacterium]|nr:CHASE3 domain-containing protein [Myxococcales bacterium]